MTLSRESQVFSNRAPVEISKTSIAGLHPTLVFLY
jgi:hypothetical protein